MNPFALYALTALVSLTLGCVSIWRVQDWRYGNIISATALEEAQSRARAATQVATAEQAMQDNKHNQEVLDGRNQKTTEALSARLRGAVDVAGRLRDPRAATCPDRAAAAAAPTGPGTEHPAETTGLLSAELTGLLLGQAKLADDINDAYASCRADGEAVRR